MIYLLHFYSLVASREATCCPKVKKAKPKQPGCFTTNIIGVASFVCKATGGQQFKPPKQRNKQTLCATKNNTRKVVSITYEEIGLFPRSFNRVFDRFLKQVFSDVENLVLQEYRFYRYLFLTTLKTLFLLVFVPFLVNFFAKNYLMRPVTEFFWNTKQPEIFLNSYQQKRAFSELQDFEETLFFESLIAPPKQLFSASVTMQKNIRLLGAATSSNSMRSQVSEVASSPSCLMSLLVGVPLSTGSSQTYLLLSEGSKPKEGLLHTRSNTFGDRVSYFTSSLASPKQLKQKQAEPLANKVSLAMQTENLLSPSVLETRANNSKQATQLRQKTRELAVWYNKNSIEAITNILSDFLSFLTLIYLLISLEIQINVTKSFLLEVFFGLEDSKKSLLILLITDLLVGYHSPNIWEFFFEFIFNHYGIPESQTVIFLLVATLPVLLDVLFKYLIFRHLNRSSPATVATYHAMIE
jgi:hypothetical protein